MKEQQHPQENSDRQIVKRIAQQEATDDNLVEIARLSIRYHNFPGAREIQADIVKILEKWHLTQEKLYEKTRQIYANAKIGKNLLQTEEQQDWS
jgi:hypothetical protein